MILLFAVESDTACQGLLMLSPTQASSRHGGLLPHSHISDRDLSLRVKIFVSVILSSRIGGAFCGT